MALTSWQKFQSQNKRGSLGSTPTEALSQSEEEKRRKRTQNLYNQYAADVDSADTENEAQKASKQASKLSWAEYQNMQAGKTPDLLPKVTQDSISESKKNDASRLDTLEKLKTGDLMQDDVKASSDNISKLSNKAQSYLRQYAEDYNNGSDLEDNMKNYKAHGWQPEKNTYNNAVSDAVAGQQAEIKNNPGKSQQKNSYIQNSDAQALASKIMDETGADLDTVNSYIYDAKKVGKFNYDKQHKGTFLNPTQENDYAISKIQSLPDDERKLMGQITSGQTSIARNSDLYGQDGSKGYFGMQSAKKNDKDYVDDSTSKNQIKAAKESLKTNYGWDDKKIEEYEGLSNRIATKNATDKLNKGLGINKNDPVGKKVFKSTVNTANDLYNFPTEGVQSLTSNLEKKPEGFGKDMNSPALYKQNASDYGTDQVVNNAITDKHPIGQQAYQIGLSAAESAETMALSAGAVGIAGGSALGAEIAKNSSLAPFTTSAYNSGYRDARNRGASELQAQEYGIASGAAEAITEKVSLDHLWNMASGTKLASRLAVDLAAHAGIEGSEEGTSDLLNRFSDYLILGKDGKNAIAQAQDRYTNYYMQTEGLSEESARKKAKWSAETDFWKQVKDDAVAGAISGGILGAGGVVAGVSNAGNNIHFDNSVKDYYGKTNISGNSEYDNNARTQAETYKNNPTQYIADNIDDSTKEGKEKKQRVQEYADKVAAGKKLSISDRNDIENSMWVAENAAENSEKSMSNRKKYDTYQNQMAAVPTEYRTPVTNITESDVRKSLSEAASKGDIEAFGDAYQKMKNSTSADLRNRADEIYDQFTGLAENNGISEHQIEGFKTSSQEAYYKGLSGEKQGDVGALSLKAAEAYRAGSEERLKNQSRLIIDSKDSLSHLSVTTNDGVNKVLTNQFADSGEIVAEDGSTVSIDDINNNDTAIHKALKMADAQPSASAKTAYLNTINDKENINQHNIAWNRFFSAGRTGLDFEKEIKNGTNKYYADTIGTDTARKMYDAGVAQTILEQSQNATRGLNKSFGIEKGNGLFEDARNDKSDEINTESLRVIANVTGLNIRLTDDSNELGSNSTNAFFIPKSSTIVVGSKNVGQAMHEVLGEFTKFYNEEGYNDVKKAVMDSASQILGPEEMMRSLNAYKKTYGRAGQSNNDFEMADEMTNDYMVAVLSTDKGRQSFSKYLSENYTEEKSSSIKDKIVKLYKSISRSLKNIITHSDLMPFQKKILQNGYDKIESDTDLIIKAFGKAVENYKSGTINNAGEKKFSLTVGGNNYSLSKDGDFLIDDNGLKIPVVNGFDFSKEDIKNEYSTVRSLVREELKKLSGKEIVIKSDSRKVMVDSKFSREYTGSKDTIRSGLERKLVKSNAYSSIENMIEIANNPIFKSNNEEKHNNNAKRGWTYYDSRVAFKSEEDLKIFSGVVNVRMSEDGKDYLYDITNFKRIGYTTAVGTSPKLSLKHQSFDSNVSQSDTNVNSSTNSEENTLTDNQKEYFKNSKVVDSEGKLIPMYHGTPRGGFTEFKNDLQFFTPEETYADKYQNPSASSRGYGKEATNPMTYKVYLNMQKPFDTRDIKTKNIFNKDYVKGGWALGIDPSTNEKDTLQKSGLPSWEEADNIYEYLDENDLLDKYDGIIVDEGGIPGDNGEVKERGISYVVWNSNQIKNIDNENPTDSNDIRFSLDVNNEDDLWDSIMDDSKESSILEDGMEALKHVDVDTKAIRNIANKIKADYASKISTDELSKNLEKAFAYMQYEDHVSYDDMPKIIREIAGPVIDQSTKLEGEDSYNDFIGKVKGMSLRLSDEQIAETAFAFGSFKEFRNAVAPLNISRSGNIDLDSAWTSICDASGGLLDYNTSDTDQPSQLYDLIKALRPSVENMYGENADEAANDLGMRIISDYLNSQNNVKSKEQAKKARESAAKMAQQLKDYRQNTLTAYRERLSDANEKLQDSRQYYRQQSGKKDAEIAKLMAKNRSIASNEREKRLKEHEKDMISKSAKALSKWITNPSEKNHVPRGMVQPISEFLTALDFVDPDVKRNSLGKFYVKVFDHSVIDENGKRSSVFKNIEADSRDEVLKKFHEEMNNGLGSAGQISWFSRMQSMKDIFNCVSSGKQFEHSNMDNFMETLDPALADEFSDVLSRNSNKASINQLSAEDMHTISKTMQAVMHAVNQGNKAYTSNGNIDEWAAKTMELADHIKDDGSHLKVTEVIKKNLRVDMATPTTFFTLNNADDVYKSLRKGFNTKIRDIRAAAEFMENDVMKGVSQKEVSKWSNTIHEFKLSDGTIRLSETQIMSLYELFRRKQATYHIPGGIKASEQKKNGKVYTQSHAVHMRGFAYANITGVLSPKQIEVAAKLQHFMANDCANWGNDASMLMYGYEKFTEKDYFPITTDKNMTTTKNDNLTNETLNSIERSGFTKATAEYANNPVLIRDIFDVFTDHVSNMATYHGYAPAIKDGNRWFNARAVSTDFNEEGENLKTETWRSVKEALNMINGKGGSDYYVKLMKDINGKEQTQYIHSPFDPLFSNYKASSVGNNVRTVIQQPCSYTRAMNVIDPKYLAVTPQEAMKAGKKMRQQSEICWWKSQGYFETSIGKSMKEIVTGQSDIGEKIKNASMTPAGIADDITWEVLYGAVTKEQTAMARQKGENLSEEELDERIKDRFDEVVDKTQVVDSTLHRSQYMRSNDFFARMETAFMAEPTKTYNMLMEAAVKDSREETFKHSARASVTFLVNATITAAAASLVDAFRKTTDDDDWGEIYLKAFRDNMADNIAPFNMIPVVKDVYGLVVNSLNGKVYGNTVDRMDLSGLASLLQSGNDALKYFSGESNKTPYGMLLSLSKGVSQVSGIPAYNLIRDTSALYNNFFPDLQKTYGSSKYTGVYNSMESGKNIDSQVTKAMENGGTIEDIQSGIKSKYKDDYYEALQTDPELASEIAEKAKEGYLSTGMTSAEADSEISSWKEETYSYSELDDAIESGEGIKEAVAKAQENKEDDKIIKHIVEKYRSTIDYNRKNKVDSSTYDNVAKAIRNVDPSLSYEKAKDNLDKLQKEKEEKAAIKEKKSKAKTATYNIIDTGKGDYKQAVQNAIDSGMNYTQIKTSLSSHYKEQILSDYNAGKNVSQTVSRIATIKAYCDECKGLKIANRYEGDYYTYEIDQMNEWITKDE